MGGKLHVFAVIHRHHDHARHRLPEGLLNLMHTQGMWAGETKPPRKPIVSKDEVAFINADKAGIFIPSVEHNGIVKKGQELAVIADPLTGEVRQTLVVMRKPEPIDTTTLNYNWQIWETNAFSVYTKETDEIDERSAQEAVAALLRYLSRVGLLRYNCHSGYLSSVVQENEMANVLTPAGGIVRRFVEPGQEVEYGQKLGVILDPFTAEVEAEIVCPTSGVVFFALKKPLTTEHEVAFKVIRRLHGGCL